ncbi:uncharacterized protein F5891DRAFT_1032047 [Suillus fuscotomentosus]|uniref:Uncharacterized protein n=1 Tax=Suillus fuscotomentosus TaxID=1912939 RepID=A0AAD4HLD2_9AGAM|nr:uncharacterized protein F5891DRAFT_1032047 [Suillus fuscotomentosus]KAG1900868.1 hypothetical protein F5891DRAFT_1032047 [Suillus fuscotomentosus]
MSSTSMCLPWPWPWFRLFVRLTLLVGAVLMQPSTVNMKVTHIQFSFKFWCIQISVTMIPVLGETLIWVPLVLVRASVFSPLFILCSTCGQREFERSLTRCCHAHYRIRAATRPTRPLNSASQSHV